MTVKKRFSLDTNILIYAIDRDAGQKHEISRELVQKAANFDCILTVQVLSEFFYASTRKNLLSISYARNLVCIWLEVFETVSATESIFIDAIEVVEEHNISFWDAMLWATVRHHRCSALISEDMQDGRRLLGVEFINPFSLDAKTRLESFLRV